MLINVSNINLLTWQRYVIFSILAGVLYALCFGFTNWDTLFTILDALGSCLVISMCSVALWNIFKYGMSDRMNSFQRISILFLYAIISIVLVLSVEFLICSIADYPVGYEIRMIPAKVLFLSLLFYSFRISFLRQQEIADQEKNNLENESIDNDLDDEHIIYDHSETIQNKDELLLRDEIKTIEHISFKIGNKIKMIQVSDLVLLKAEDDYVSFVTSEGHWLKKGTMKEFGALLPKDKFVRVHRSYIVNIDKISKIECYGQKHQLQLNTGVNLWISISGYKALRKTLGL